MFIPPETAISFQAPGLASFHSSGFWLRSAAMSGVWHFYVGFRSLPQKNCTIWMLSKGYGIWIAPYALFFLCHQIVQPKPKTKNRIDNVVAKSHLRSFAMSFFISNLLYTIFVDLRSFLWMNKEFRLRNSCAAARLLLQPFTSARHVHPRGAFLIHRT